MLCLNFVVIVCLLLLLLLLFIILLGMILVMGRRDVNDTYNYEENDDGDDHLIN